MSNNGCNSNLARIKCGVPKWFILGPLEILMFNSPKKQLDLELEIKLNGKNLYQTDSVTHLRTHIDKTLI